MIPALVTLLIVGSLFGTFFVLERFIPLRARKAELIARLAINLCFSALAFGVAAVLVRPAAQATLYWAGVKPFGLIHLVPLLPAAQFIIAFLLMDLSFYWWHWLNHRIPFLWRFHNVHHIDPDLDVSTVFRFHFGEAAMSVVFRVVPRRRRRRDETHRHPDDWRRRHLGRHGARRLSGARLPLAIAGFARRRRDD